VKHKKAKRLTFKRLAFCLVTSIGEISNFLMEDLEQLQQLETIKF